VEALVTGHLEATDLVSYQGAPFVECSSVEELARFLPTETAIATAVTGPDLSQGRTPLSPMALLSHLADGWRTGGDVAIVCERPSSTEAGRTDRKEIYLRDNFLHQVASNEPNELLGEFLFRRGQLDARGLDLAKAQLERYDGRMGDTLIALGLADPMTVFQAIREQGRARLGEVFAWTSGTLLVVPGDTKLRPEFPLKLDILQVLCEVTSRASFEVPRGPFVRTARRLQGTPPPLLDRTLEAVSETAAIPFDIIARHLLRDGYTELDARRAVHIAMAAALIRIA
jgi:serine/threonine-protein kinase